MKQYLNAIATFLCASALTIWLIGFQPAIAFAGPVDWQEVTPTAEGRQWWDKGSLRRNRKGELTVLSRFSANPDQSGKSQTGALYVMALDCDEQLYKDLQVNGLPRPRTQWQLVGSEDLIAEVLQQSCAAARGEGLLEQGKA
ncbi:hypothetical protein [Synechococcus sp. UW140]|uniref:hypothetical protein n=1 Tax=Synechococcus sp. UW140 TaxID=368503 RepID=UPI0031379363